MRFGIDVMYAMKGFCTLLFYGIKLPQALQEIDNVRASTVLEELAQTNQQLAGELLSPPKLLSAMVASNQTFYKNDRPNPWLSAYTEQVASHARL